VSTASSMPKPWAVLAYTVADDKSGSSELDAAAKRELRAICEAADFGQVNVAAQVDFKHTRGIWRGLLTEKPTLRVTKVAPTPDDDDDDHPLWRSIVGSIKRSLVRGVAEKVELNAARADVLQDFLRFGQRGCPADRYVVTFYGHAYGPMGLFFDADARQRTATTLRLNDLASSIEGIEGKAAVVIFRDCFMNTLETAYQLRRAAEFMLASQSVVPVAGVWPWLQFMTALMPSAVSGDVGRALAVQLAHFLDEPSNRGPFEDVPYSLIDLEETETVVKPLKALVSGLEAVRTDAKRAAACAKALEASRIGYPDDHSNPGDPALLDVPTMCDKLKAVDADAVAGPARALGEAVRERLVRWHHSQKKAYQGISLYYQPVKPHDIERSFIMSGNAEDAAKDAEYYAQLALCEATGWHRIALNPLRKASAAGTARGSAS
jgi:cysteine peptidase C11 family protein